ncbi:MULTISPECIES: hypothetical protein [unclassified Pseudoxanthomonas]|uniref:hypothetical protein n=1 Tax=unclassified Pseudoxanthomonas TaxID=2645906 RepID=UPI00160FFEBF|nr:MULTISPECIES: hypothetical protein [unclassified Pseudoxanthomonas]MBB3276896.1 hypothetical protein [Pseudoxanthomonas sp. OG2]MBV7475812.1 hypothetical protein [Pseudoxanthomonas sp. PXM05]
MDAISLFIVGMGAIAMLAVAAWFAWLVAWRSDMPMSARRSFILVCLLLSFGFFMLAGVAFLPLGLADVFVVPQWAAGNHERTAIAVHFLSEYGPITACLIAGLLASFIVPLKLRHVWPQMRLVMRGGK